MHVRTCARRALLTRCCRAATPSPLCCPLRLVALPGPPSSWYIKQAAGLSRGADRTGHEFVGAISLKHLYEIAKVKAPDMPGMSLRGVVKCLMSQCQSMGVRVVERPEDA